MHNTFNDIGRRIATNGWGREYANEREALMSVLATDKDTTLCLLAACAASLVKIEAELIRARAHVPSKREPDLHAISDGMFRTLFHNVPAIPLVQLGLSVRARKALARLDVKDLFDVTQLTEDTLLECRNCGISTVEEIKQAIAKHGVTLRLSE